jgi:hypothetical protein
VIFVPRKCKNESNLDQLKLIILQSLSYDEETGKLYWKKSGMGRPLHKIAGTTSGNGYRYINISGYKLKATHCIWILKTGNWPVGVIDHIDRNSRNDKWNNLRDITQADNIRNGKIRKDNNTGFKGITYQRNYKYKVRKNGKHIGVFDSLEKARIAYDSKM